MKKRRLLLSILPIFLLASCNTPGPQGPKGEPGEPGQPGIPGDPGEDGVTPFLKIGTDNYWYVSYDNGVTWTSLNVKATGESGKPGDPGEDGTTPLFKIGNDNYWYLSYDNGETWTSLNVKATGNQGLPGTDGLTPEIGDNGNWWIGDKDTNVPAQGKDGKDGKDGTSLLTGYGKPSDSLGKDGDSYIDLLSWDFYTKSEGAWTKVGNIGYNNEEKMNALIEHCSPVFENCKSASEFGAGEKYEVTQVAKISDGTYANNINGYLMKTNPNNIKGEGSVFFWYGEPTKTSENQKFPCVFVIHGGGGHAFYPWVEYWLNRGYACLAIDIAGHMYSGTFTHSSEVATFNDNDPNLLANPTYNAKTLWGSVGSQATIDEYLSSWEMVNMQNIMLAHSYVTSKRNADPQNMFATGISWGGFTTCVLSGFDNRFKAFAPVYGCGRQTVDSWGRQTAGFAYQTDEYNHDVWDKLYDPRIYVKKCTKPILFVSGMKDPAFSPVSRKTTSDLIQDKNNLYFAYIDDLPHGHYPEMTPSVDNFFDSIKNNTVPADKIIGTYFVEGKDASGNTIYTPATSYTGEFDKIVLYYTDSSNYDSHSWEWKSIDVTAYVSKTDKWVGYTLPFVSATQMPLAFFFAGFKNGQSYPISSSDIMFIRNQLAFI